jgi:LPS export ABC transporter protein LptC
VRLFLISVACVAAISCRKSTPPPTAGTVNLADSADQILFDVRSPITQSGVKRGEMLADTIYVFRDQTLFVMRRVRASFNTETGAPNGTLRGDNGTYDFRTQVLEGFGNVVVTSTKGERLSSNHLKYNQALNEISSDSAYTLVRNNETQRGIGFRSDPNLAVFRCLRSCGGSAPVPLGGLPRR